MIELEETVFRQVSISEDDFHLYFDEKTIVPNGVDNSIVGIFSEMKLLHSPTNQEEFKKIFAGYVFPDYSYKKEAAPPTTEEFFQLLRNSSAKAAFKWEFFEIYCNLEEHRNRAKALIEPVVQILKQHEAVLLKLLHDYASVETPHFLKDQQFLGDLNVKEIIMDYSVFGFNAITLRMPDITPDVVYLHYGIYVDTIAAEKARLEKAGMQAVDKWRSLSDKSRIRILCLLKEREMFGQELTEALGLSNATISHHMNDLLTEDFVLLRKEGSKVLYRLNREKIAEAIEEMRLLLLE